MIPVQDMLNKIKWDPRENPEDYALMYFDRIEHKLIELRFVEIKDISDGALVVMQEGREVNIPLHRIKIIKKQGKVVWER